MSDTEPGSRVGSWFGPYQLMGLLGRGGMGDVYEAEDVRKRRRVALKLVSEQFSGNPVFRARMQREADAAGRLTEPHVVPIHDYGDIDGRFYVEMRLIDGTDLSTLLKRSGPLSPPRAVAVVRQIAAALDAAHAIGVTHRDVKPENILLTGDDFAYLVDFGIARAATDPGLTQTGTAMGSYGYMAPERFSGDEVTHRADIYSLACVLGECLTGSPPYRSDSIERLVAAHLMEPAPRPSELRPGDVPPAFDQVLAKGMAKKPDERYNSAGELAAAAHNALTTSDQHHAAAILRQGENAALRPPAGDAGLLETTRAGYTSPGAETMAGPAPSGTEAASWGTQPPAARRPDGAGTSDFDPVAPHRRKRTLGIVVAAAALIVVAAAAVTVFLVMRPSQPPSPSPHSASGQTVLPFDGLNFRLSPGGVALDNDGAVYVTNQGMYGRVVKLANGSTTPTVLPFTGLYEPQSVAVDRDGNVYVTDFNNRVVKLPTGSNNQTVLPFTDLMYPEGVAVDDGGTVYVADRGNNRVLKLAAGADTQTELPFTGLNHPDGVAVSRDGTVYVADSDNNRVLKLTAGADTQTELPFTGLAVPWGVAVDRDGTVYVTEHENHKAMKLAPGANAPTVLPFTGLNTPLDLTVDPDGNVYIADRGNDRVLKLTADR